MSNTGLLIGVGSVVVSTFAHVCLKAGAANLPKSLEGIGPSMFAQLITNGYLMAGVALHGVALAIWMVALSKLDLSVAYPLMALGYPLVMIAAYFIFNEPLTLHKIAGVFLIGSGVLLISATA